MYNVILKNKFNQIKSCDQVHLIAQSSKFLAIKNIYLEKNISTL